jgi:LacI family transcriptional regulator
MRPTLIDIAKQTNTSVSTVSRVLTGGRVAQHVSDETKSRVLAAAKAIGYRPNLVARGLRTRRTGAVALLVSDIANPWFARLASLIEQSLHRRGYSLVLCNSGEDPEIEAEYLNLLPQKGIDGLILVPLIRTKKALYEFVPADLPLVVLDRPIPGISATVHSDEEQLAGLLCDTLGRALVRRIAIVSGPHNVITHRRRTELVSKCFNVVATHEGPAQPETGRQAFIKFIANEDAADQPLDAIVCTNNFLGQGVIDAIAMLERPPVIACFDEIPMMHLLPLPIACSIQDVPMLAEACVTQLMPQLERDGEPPKPMVIPARAITNRAFQMRLFGQEVIAR